MTDSTPPIPPNSHMFEWNNEDGEWDFILPLCGAGGGPLHIRLSHATLPEYRPVISYAARCSWLDQMQRISMEHPSGTRNSRVRRLKNELVSECGRIASAWKGWGEECHTQIS